MGQSNTVTNQAALEALLQQSASIASHSKSVLEAAGNSPSNSLGSICSSGATGSSNSSRIASRLHRQLVSLLPRLPPAVTDDSRCTPLKTAIAQLPSAFNALSCSDTLLHTARVAVATLAEALTNFAGDLRMAHICREEAEEASRQASARAEDFRSKSDAAVLDGLVCFDLLILWFKTTC
jgi:hypothetical protein